jgi:hypothetical protein
MLKKQVDVGDQCRFMDAINNDERYSSENEPDDEISLDCRPVGLVVFHHRQLKWIM